MKLYSTKDNLQVLYEDNHLIAINKRAGDIVQGDSTGDKPLSEVVKEYIKEKYNKPGAVYLGVVHRLDRPTTGIVIFAKTSKALSRMNQLFKDRNTKKTYYAIVKNQPPKSKDFLTHYLVRNSKKNQSIAYTNPTPNAKEAKLDYEIVKKSDHYYILKVELHTGRHHQIRSQLKAIGCPIKGDLKYGAERSNPDGSIHLHARDLSFIHPVKKEMIAIRAPFPKDSIWKLMEN